MIDLAGYNEHTIGNFETAKIVFLGNNPGSAGVLGENQEQEMRKIRRSVQFLKRYPGLFDTFYPIVNNELMRFKPWFGNNLRRSDSILGPFLQINPDISRFAPYIASAELSPYHTRYFNDAGLDELSWEKNEEVYNKIRHCMKHGVVLIAIYAGAKDRWIRQTPELANYESFYFCHNIPRGTPHFGDEMESLHNPDQSAYGEILETVKRLFPVNIIN